VVAEGVETPEQFALLKAWGCREVQGFYFAKPLPAEEVEELLRKRTLAPRPSRRPAPCARAVFASATPDTHS
jgi:sensor c-di-GMP phosphodiesterase-like protein